MFDFNICGGEKWIGRVGLQMRLSSPFLSTKTKQEQYGLNLTKNI